MAPYFYNIIYNRPEGIDTEDSRLALNFVEYLVLKIAGWGHEGYFADRDAIPGRNIFDELFRIVSETEKTIVVITPEFRSNYWAKYSKQAAFKYLMDEKHQDKMIPIAVNIDYNQSLRELNVNEPLHIKGLTEDDWERNRSNRRCFDRLKQAFNQQRVVEEIGDNRLRTEGQQHLVTRPASETSMSSVTTNNAEIGDNRFRTEGQQHLVTRPASETYMSSVATNNADQRHNYNDSISAGYQSVVIDLHDRPLPNTVSVRQGSPLQRPAETQSLLYYDGDTSSADFEVLPEGTNDGKSGGHAQSPAVSKFDGDTATADTKVISEDTNDGLPTGVDPTLRHSEQTGESAGHVQLPAVSNFDGDTVTVDIEWPSEDTNGRLPTKVDPTLTRTGQTGKLAGHAQSPAVSNFDDDRISSVCLGRGQNGKISASRDLPSLSNDRDLSVDLIRSFSVTQGSVEVAQQNSIDARPETLGAEGVTDTRPDIAKLSLGSFEEDYDSEVLDQNQTVPKGVLQQESGYTTLSDDTPSSSAEPDLLNQTDDAKSSAQTPSQLDPLHYSGTSPVGRLGNSTESALREKGTKISSRIVMLCQTVIEGVFNVDKAYQS